MLKIYLLLSILLFIECNYTLSLVDKKIIFNLYHYSEKQIIFGDEIFTKYFINNATHRIDKTDYPDLPIIRKPLLGMNLKFQISKLKEYSANTKPIISIREQKNRCSNNSEINYKFADIYNSNALYPINTVELYKFHTAKNINGYILEINPITYNPVSNHINIVEYLEIDLIDRQVPMYSYNKKVLLSKSDYDLFKQLFLNFGLYNIHKNNFDRLLIISADRFFNLGIEFANHKASLGYSIIYKKVSEISNIKTYIKALHDEPESLKYVVFIGNENDIPMLYSHEINSKSDSMYGQVYEGMYNINVFISRITGNNEDDINKQLSKIYMYERQINYKKVNYLGIASDEDQPLIPTDCEFMGQLHKMINESSKDKDYIFNLECDPETNKDKVKSFINKGMNFINYIGHGTGTLWVTSKFDIHDAYGLSNDYINPLVIDVSCNNGNLSLSPCLAESMMISNNKGAGTLAMYSSIPLADWIPPVYMQYYAHFIFQRNVNSITIGQMVYGGTMMSCVMYPDRACKKMTDGYILFGDSSINVRKAP